MRDLGLQPTERNANLPAPNFRALFDAVPGPCLVVLPNDPAFTIVAVNKAYSQATLTKPDEIVGRGLFEVFPDNPDDSQATGVGNVHASLRRVLLTRASDTMPIQKYDIRQPAAEGGSFEERYWSSINAPVTGEDGEVTHIIHRVEDVTEFVRLKTNELGQGKAAGDVPIRAERMEAELFLRGRQLGELQRLLRERQAVEERLLATEARFSLAFAQAPIGMVLLTPDGGIVEVNQAFLDMLGYTREELASGDSSFFTHPEDVALTRDFFVSLREGPHSTDSIEKRYVRKDGEVLWVCASATMRRDHLGMPAQVIAIVEDITARKRAEARYRFLAETIPQMVWTATPDGMLDYVNGQGTAFFGAPQQALLGAGWVAWVHPEDQNQTIARWQHSLETGERYETEFRLKRDSDSSWRWHLVRALPLVGDNGRVVQWFGTYTDIEDQRQADSNLRQQWHTFDTALSNTPDFIYILDLAGRFTYVNRALLALWQKSLGEACGKNFFELDYPAELAERLQLQIQQVIDTGQPLRDQTPFTGPTGETRYYEYILVPVFGNHGRVESVTGSTRDITDRMRIEEALAASEEKLQQVFAQAPVAIVVFRGRDFLVELANPFYQALLEGREMVGRRFADIVPELAPEVWDAFHRVLDTGEPFVANEFPVTYDQDRDGVIEDHWFNVVYHPLRQADGAVSGMVAVCSDVTAQVIARQELEKVNRSLEEFAYVASHDLQEPLRMVNIYSQLIRKRVGDGDATLNQYVKFVQQGATRMEQLIQDLLSFSRTVHDSGLPLGRADLSASLSEALSVLKDRIEESGATINSPPLPIVHGDTDQLAHVFQNLISNSLKYRRPSVAPEISISAVQEGNRWIICFRDNGIGFDQRYANQIFGLFKRLHKDEYPGTGLGLAICQRIVERYGGHIWAEGRLGEGATFYFSVSGAAEAQ